MLTELASREKVIGVKQSARAIRMDGPSRYFWPAARTSLFWNLSAAPAAVFPVEEGYTMAQLGRACGIAVGPPL